MHIRQSPPRMLRRLRSPWSWLARLGVALLVTSTVSAQRISLEASRQPYYVGEPIQLRLAVDGLEEQPQPACQLGNLSDALTVELIGVTPQISRSISIVNGKTTRTVRVRHVLDYRITASRAGKFVIGPFRVTQGDRQVERDAVTLVFDEIENDPDLRIDVELPAAPFFVGQRIPITIMWAYAGDVRSVSKLAIYSPLFDRFEFEDTPATQSDQVLPIETAAGTLQLVAQYARRTIDGRTFTTAKATRMLVANEPGEFEIPPVTATMRTGGRSRDLLDSLFDDPFFGRSRQPTSPPLRAEGQPLRFAILPLPLESRPATFHGAVGDGFRLEVQTNRSVVRVGDPISLTITIRGNGNLASLELPPLAGPNGLPVGQFRLPTDPIAGRYDDGAKQFDISVRVEKETVREIPPITFSWFNPSTQQYESTASDPIAMQVMPAQVVSSTDVVASQAATEAADAVRDEVRSRNENPAVRTAVSSPTSTIDLAIETNTDALLRPGRRPWRETAVPITFYSLGIAALGFAVWDVRRKQIDPAISQRRRLVMEQRERIREAQLLPPPAAARTAADALRSTLTIADRRLRPEMERLISQCDNIAFAPSDDSWAALDPQLFAQADEILTRLQESSL